MMRDSVQRATNLKYHISSQYNLHCSHSTHITTCRSPWWPPLLSCSAPWSDALLLLVNPTTLCKWYPILLLPWLSKHYPSNIQHILPPRLSKKHSKGCMSQFNIPTYIHKQSKWYLTQYYSPSLPRAECYHHSNCAIDLLNENILQMHRSM